MVEYHKAATSTAFEAQREAREAMDCHLGRRAVRGRDFCWTNERHPDDNISPSDVQQGIASSPIPFNKLNLQNRPRALVALGSYLVNGVGDCVGCHTLPRFLRP